MQNNYNFICKGRPTRPVSSAATGHPLGTKRRLLAQELRNSGKLQEEIEAYFKLVRRMKMNLSFQPLRRSALLLITMAFACRVAQPGQAPASPDLEEQVRTQEEVCILNLRAINVAQITYQGGDETKGFARALRELGPARAGILEQAISTGVKSGYRFRLVPERTTANQPIRHYVITAQPVKRLVRHQRSFFMDETGIIRSTTQNRAATSADPPLEAPHK